VHTQLIFADSIDLQERTAPSAQDHTHTTSVGVGSHQAEALRGVAAEAADQHTRSPRVSREWSNGEIQGLQQHDDGQLAAAVTASLAGANHQQDDLAVAQNGGLTGSTAEDAEMADAEGDDGHDDDDDMMDKISSSPSIDDGGYPLPLLWPRRSESLSRKFAPIGSSSTSQACSESSTPNSEEPAHCPLRPLRNPSDKDVVPGAQVKDIPYQHHHLLGEYLDCPGENGSENDAVVLRAAVPTWPDPAAAFIENYESETYLDRYFEQAPGLSDQRHEPEREQGRGAMTIFYQDSEEEIIPYEDSEDEDARTIPYGGSLDEDDDDYDIPYTDDSRFIDSGWGGECLHVLEDIDFEFVYALHTFVATVEGQANATKGDTMVLLDDSNSYWWLVRVVKDSSIGSLLRAVCGWYGLLTVISRVLTSRAHRNPDGKTSTPE
jgi:hypothetical protein